MASFCPFWPGVLSDAGRRSVKTLKLQMCSMFANCVWFVILQAEYILWKTERIYIAFMFIVAFYEKTRVLMKWKAGPKPTSRTCPLPHYKHMVGWKFDIDTKHWFGAYYNMFSFIVSSIHVEFKGSGQIWPTKKLLKKGCSLVSYFLTYWRPLSQRLSTNISNTCSGNSGSGRDGKQILSV